MLEGPGAASGGLQQPLVAARAQGTSPANRQAVRPTAGPTNMPQGEWRAVLTRWCRLPKGHSTRTVTEQGVHVQTGLNKGAMGVGVGWNTAAVAGVKAEGRTAECRVTGQWGQGHLHLTGAS